MPVVVLSNAQSAQDPMALARAVLAQRQADYDLYRHLTALALEAAKTGNQDLVNKYTNWANTMGGNIFGYNAQGDVNVGGNQSEASYQGLRNMQEYFDRLNNWNNQGAALKAFGETAKKTGDNWQAATAGQHALTTNALAQEGIRQSLALGSNPGEMFKQIAQGNVTAPAQSAQYGGQFGANTLPASGIYDQILSNWVPQAASGKIPNFKINW